jgi:hypothetical protein
VARIVVEVLLAKARLVFTVLTSIGVVDIMSLGFLTRMHITSKFEKSFLKEIVAGADYISLLCGKCHSHCPI